MKITLKQNTFCSSFLLKELGTFALFEFAVGSLLLKWKVIYLKGYKIFLSNSAYVCITNWAIIACYY